MNKTLIKKFALGLRPQKKLSIVDWAKKYVKVPRSSRSEFLDLNLTPFLIKPIQSSFDNSVKQLILKAPIGGGKSTFVEFLLCYILAEKPGPTLVATQNEKDMKDWVDVGILPTLKGCSALEGLWPEDRYAITKDLMNFPTMPIWLGGSNHSNFQSKSCQYVIIDEAWTVKDGLLGEAEKRNHDRFGAKFIMVSQAGDANHDFSKRYNESHIYDFCFKCRNCGEFHPYKFENLKYTIDKSESDEYLWETVKCHYECDCGEIYENDSKTRRWMTSNSDYINVRPENNNPKQGHIAYHYNALAVFWVSWEKLVIEWLAANIAKKNGDYMPIKQFKNKRLAEDSYEFDDLDKDQFVSPNRTAGYTLNTREQWDKTILTVDVQSDEFWYVIRTWRTTGESRLLEYGKLLNFTDIEKKRAEWNIPSTHVFLDSAYRTEEVKLVCAKYKWFGLNGRPDRDFQWPNKVRRYYSQPNKIHTSNGIFINTYFASESVKDLLIILKRGDGLVWQIPDDVTQQYINSINAETRKLTAKGYHYVQHSTHNHFLDCESSQIIAAMLLKCYPFRDLPFE